MDDAAPAPLPLPAVRRRYPRLYAEYAHLSDRERRYLSESGDPLPPDGVDAATGLLTTMGCTDFTEPLEDTGECPMQIESDAHRFGTFVGKCLDACEAGRSAGGDARRMADVWEGALDDALAMETMGERFEHMLGWTMAGARHGLAPAVERGDPERMRGVFRQAGEAWRTVFEEMMGEDDDGEEGAMSDGGGVSDELQTFALWMCAVLQTMLRDAKEEFGDDAAFPFDYAPQRMPKRRAGAPKTGKRKASTAAPDGDGTTPKRVTVTIIKPTRDAKLGLGIGQRKGSIGVRVNSKVQGGLFASTPLEVGMVLESVNGRRYASFAECLALLKNAVGTVTIVAVAREGTSPVPHPAAEEAAVPQSVAAARGWTEEHDPSSSSSGGSYLPSSNASSVYDSDGGSDEGS